MIWPLLPEIAVELQSRARMRAGTVITKLRRDFPPISEKEKEEEREILIGEKLSPREVNIVLRKAI